MQAKTRLDDILARLRETEKELEQELDKLLASKREQFNYSLSRGKVVFERGVRLWQRQQRTGLWLYLRKAPLAYILSAPLIYGMIIPLLILDLCTTLYQHICFRIYHIPRVRRSEYMVIDRHHLAYLNIIEKFNCLYCGYGNGLMAYAREVVARTEQYWCPIKHARRVLDPHSRAQRFLDYGDSTAWHENLQKFRQQLTDDSEAR
ncbi:MAG: hypothetical protein H8E21_01035 [Gammaproteobacteria bacterium]|nr:hypothetical protein [Gammaproteobacteria bacterium]MBL6999817.1 hypothetical protein [Gammaproteobacteria bacterium]